jgi:hypothetical protein
VTKAEEVISELWIWNDVEGNSGSLIVRYYLSFCSKALRKTAKKLRIADLRGEIEPEASEYELGILTIRPRRPLKY